ncbi:hypothetical protein P167DRAFT_533559 [Morchella conica CCBAS932]|uniref:Uncharacterized protein n=1 Tax=Morchella conica CCBAS932 TaxID=1392247 RepID=A0A3N4KZR0_9PEZI|nr:hypothetical protein P167DRAFT_533559 [Morchella conica CCBAS932]
MSLSNVSLYVPHPTTITSLTSILLFLLRSLDLSTTSLQKHPAIDRTNFSLCQPSAYSPGGPNEAVEAARMLRPTSI